MYCRYKALSKKKKKKKKTKTAYLGGENEGGLVTGESVDERVAFGSART